MKITKFTIALLSAAVVFTSCNDDDDLGEGRFDRAELYATSNTSGAVTVYDFSDSDEVTATTLNVTGSTNNEGIFYDGSTNQLIFADVAAGNLRLASNIEDLINGTNQTLTTVSSTGGDSFDSAKDVTANDNFVIVSNNDGDDNNDELFIFTRSGNTLTFRNTVEVDFELWQIQLVGNDLYAVVDKTNELAVFTNFLNNTTNDNDDNDSNDISATKRISIEGIQRTHGLVYNQEDDIMILTDIGEAMGDTAATDGGFHIITNFTSKFQAVADGGTLPVAGNQVRVAGSATFLGNPVAASYDSETNTIFIAERANTGGRILGFDAGANGNVAPIINNLLPGASTVFFYGED